MSVSKPEELLALELSCAICLQLYSDPVSLPCGHSYCQRCICEATQGDRPKGPARCPECREEFSGAEGIHKNFKLSAIVEGYRATAAVADLDEGGGESVVATATAAAAAATASVWCDHCLESPVEAVKTCLRCEMSLCPAHLRRHEERQSSRGHTLVDPRANPDPDPNACPEHGRPLEYLCRMDRAFLCSACILTDGHLNHELLAFEAAESEMRRVLLAHSKAAGDRLQLTGVLLRRASQSRAPDSDATETLLSKADAMLEKMAELVIGYKTRMKELFEEEEQQREQAWQTSVGLLEEQQRELQETQAIAKDVLCESDHLLFIRRYLPIESRLRRVSTLPIAELPASHGDGARQVRAGLRTDAFRSEVTLLLRTLHGLLNPLWLTFDPCTVHSGLLLSADLRTVRLGSGSRQGHQDRPERFSSAPQVLCTQGLASGTHVWAVEVAGGGQWSAGLCYASVPRRGEQSRLGHNSVSWRLQWKNRRLSVAHDAVSVLVVGAKVPLRRLEVTLDYEAGTLAFHCVSGHRKHLYTFHTIFRETVYPAFGIHASTEQSWITLLDGI